MRAVYEDPVERLFEAAEAGQMLIQNREILHFTYIPDVIRHRDTEQKQVAQSLLPILKQSKPSNLLVYGKPGTGKTLVVRKILDQIRERVDRSEFPIRLVYSNAKEETTLYGLFISLGKQLGLSDKDMPATGLAIAEIFRRILAAVSKGALNVVFVIDEIDHLAHMMAKTHNDVLYQLTRANERVKAGSITIVGISNDLTFKERLDPRVISTLREEEIVFTNYTISQIQSILRDRIGAAFVAGSVSDPALSLCAAMAGREHGDARRALDLLRVAGEVAEREQAPAVTEVHIREAASKIEENKEVTALRSYPLHEKLLILAVMRAQGSTTGEIYTTYKSLARTIRQSELTNRRVTQMLSEIEMSGMISGRIAHQGRHGRTKKFRLMVSPDMVKRTFAGDLALVDVL